MKYLWLLLTAGLLATTSSAQMINGIHGSHELAGNDSYAPLLVFTNGAGKILPEFPYRDGDLLKVGCSYDLYAVADPGYVFLSWNVVNEFTYTEYEPPLEPGGGPIPVTSIDLVQSPITLLRPEIRMTVQPVEVLLDLPNVRVITQTIGWQANFAPRPRPGR